MNRNTQKGVPEPQAALDKIKIIENGEPLIDIRVVSGLTLSEMPEHKVVPFLRAHVVEMLKEAAAILPAEFHFHVISAFRDIAHQKEIWQHHYDRYKLAHPEWPDSTLRRMITKYVAPFDHPAPPGHSTGAAVDVVLQRSDGSFVDLVPPFLTDWSLGHTWTDKIDAETKKYRMLLVETMLRVGFSNCRDEYWHYSWGDSGWAVRVGEKECPYGAAELPK